MYCQPLRSLSGPPLRITMAKGLQGKRQQQSALFDMPKLSSDFLTLKDYSFTASITTCVDVLATQGNEEIRSPRAIRYEVILLVRTFNK